MMWSVHGHAEGNSGAHHEEKGGALALSGTGGDWLARTRASYDADAGGYTQVVRGLLDRHPLLRLGLAAFADVVRDVGVGPVADVGCGPGYVTRHLHDLGIDAQGIDLSPEMISIARRDHPDLRFDVGTMTALDLADHTLAGIVAFWSVIHVPDSLVPGVFEEFRRVLRRGSPVLIGFHVGNQTTHSSRGYQGVSIDVDTHHRQPATVAPWLREAGFSIEAEVLMRPDDEVPGAMILARSGLDAI